LSSKVQKTQFLRSWQKHFQHLLLSTMLNHCNLILYPIGTQLEETANKREKLMTDDLVLALLGSIAGNVLLFAPVFGFSASIRIDKLKEQLQNRTAILVGIRRQFFLLPALGFLVVLFMDFEPPVGLSILVLTSSPGGSYSNWFCSVFNADLALSVAANDRFLDGFFRRYASVQPDAVHEVLVQR
jgi:hypothetical protein